MATMWWTPFTVERYRLVSPLPPDECAQQIRSGIYRLWNGSNPALPFNGSVRHSRFTLCKNTPGFRSAFRPLAYGTIRSGEDGIGTAINLRLALGLPTRMWFVLLLAMMAMICVLSWLNSVGMIGRNPGLGDPLVTMVVMLFAAIVFYALYLIMSWGAGNESTFLIGKFQQIMQASIA